MKLRCVDNVADKIKRSYWSWIIPWIKFSVAPMTLDKFLAADNAWCNIYRFG